MKHNGIFFERYGKYVGYGWGCMLVYLDEMRKMTYVRFTKMRQGKDLYTIIDKGLETFYKTSDVKKDA